MRNYRRGEKMGLSYVSGVSGIFCKEMIVFMKVIINNSEQI